MRAAMDKCDETGLKVCQWANEAASGATADKIAELRTEATNELAGASSVLNAAQAKLDATDISLDQLRTSKAVLDGLRSTLVVYNAGSGIADRAGAMPDSALAAAKAAAKAASTAREKMDFLSQRVQNLSSQISKIVAPFVSSDPEAAALDTSAQALGKDIPDAGMFDFGALLTMASPVIDAVIANQKAIEKAIGNVDIDAIVSAANDALTSADAQRRGAKELASGPDRYKSLQNASLCFAMMGEAGKQMAEATTQQTDLAGNSPSSASTGDDEMVDVPNATVAESIDYARTIIQQAGFVAVFNAKKPEKKADELKIAGQDPPPGKIKKSDMAARGNKVIVFINQKFDEAGDTVPPLKGLTLEQATQTLAAANLTIGGLDNSAKTEKQDEVNKIFEQSPSAGSKVPENKRVSVRIFGSLVSKGPPPPTDNLAQLIPGPEKDLIGNFSGNADHYTYDDTDWKHEHPHKSRVPIDVGISHDGDKWSFSARMPSIYSGYGGGSGTLTVTGGVLTYETDTSEWHGVVKVQVSGDQLNGSYQATSKIKGYPQPPPVAFDATRVK
jgi:hypothetical protein